MRYASQPLDSSYALYLNDVPEAGPSGKMPKARARDRREQNLALDALIRHFAQKHAVDIALIRAIIEVESAFDPNAISAKGAAGLMQLMPATATRYGVTDHNDVAQNLEAGIRYLKDLLTLYDGNVVLALASYNAGEHAVARHGKRIPPYKETMLYVPAVLAKLPPVTQLPNHGRY